MKTQLIFSANNPIVFNHRVYEKMILPGMAYIDLIFQFLRKKGLQPTELEIKRLTIHNPLVVEENSKVIASVTDIEVGPGQWKVTIEGKKLYANAVVVQAAGYQTNVAPDIISFKHNAESSFPIADVYKRYEESGLKHTGFMRAEGMIYKDEQGILFEAALGPEAISTADQFMFHPAILDASAVSILPLFNAFVKEDENLFLPVYFDSFRSGAPINKRCFSYMPFSSVKRINEITSYSIYFFDESGKKTGEIINLTSKIVREGFGKMKDRKMPQFETTELLDEEKDLVVFLKQLIASHLNMDPLSIDAGLPYYNMGFDSVSLLQLAEVIAAKIEVELPPTLLFEYTTIHSLANHLYETYTEKFTAFRVVENQ
jgi:polyketide synthase PksM